MGYFNQQQKIQGRNDWRDDSSQLQTTQGGEDWYVIAISYKGTR